MEGGKPANSEKNPRSRDENQQRTQPAYDQNRTQATLVASEHSQHCSIPAPSIKCIYSRKLPACSNISCLFIFFIQNSFVYWQCSETALYGNGEMGKVWNVSKLSAFWGNTIYHLFKSHAHALFALCNIAHVVLAYTQSCFFLITGSLKLYLRLMEQFALEDQMGRLRLMAGLSWYLHFVCLEKSQAFTEHSVRSSPLTNMGLKALLR